MIPHWLILYEKVWPINPKICLISQAINLLGIPAEFRSEVWWQVSGAAEKQKTESADYYSKLLTTTPPTDCPYIAQIEKALIN